MNSSPQGRIFQVEYASEAVKQGSVVVGIVSKTHAVLVALKVHPSFPLPLCSGPLASYDSIELSTVTNRTATNIIWRKMLMKPNYSVTQKNSPLTKRKSSL